VTSARDKDRIARYLRRSGIARSRELERIGVSRKQIRRFVDRGLIERIGWGLYRLPGVLLTERHVCLLSALRFHELTTQSPFEIWMAIERKAWRPPRGNPPLRLVFASGAAFREGVEKHRVGGVLVPVYGIAKTVVDCFKYRNKIGLDVALEALRDAWRRKRLTMDEIDRFARICRVERVMRPYLEALVA
jgi:predicted transcriptional regulator of viral defense system